MSTKQKNQPRTLFAWCMYDFANSPFSTLVVTFIYAAFFTEKMVGDKNEGTSLWAMGVTITAIVVAVLSPFMGALADRGGYRKRFLLTTTAICVVGTAALYPILPGQAVLALSIFVIANIAFEMGMVFYNAFLPDITTPDRIGRVSGTGWALGYGGGLLALVIALVGFVQPEQPWFGFSKEGFENIRATNLLAAAWFALFTLPLLFWVKEDKSTVSRSGRIISATVSQLRNTLTEIRQYRQIVLLLVGRMIYNDGLVTIFAFGGIYAAGTFGFEFEEILIFGIVLNITAGLGAFAMGFLDDRIGGVKTIKITLWGLTIAALIAIFAPSKTVFWIAGILVGIFSGPNQSASRSLMGRFVPPAKENEFFGFFAFSGKATAFLGPAALSLLTTAFQSQRAGIAVVVILFGAGLLIVNKIDETAGIAAARREA